MILRILKEIALTSGTFRNAHQVSHIPANIFTTQMRFRMRAGLNNMKEYPKCQSQ
jgi:hypothetical protein